MLCKVIVFLLCFLQFSNGLNFTKNAQKIVFPDHFGESIQNYLTNNKNAVSKQCKFQLIHYAKALIKLVPWAVFMFDAGSKIPSGILSGNLVGLGNFDQCLKIQEDISGGTIIYGKHCVGEIPLGLTEGKSLKSIKNAFNMFATRDTRMLNLEGTFFTGFATCLPHLCSSVDIQQLYSGIGINNIKFNDLLCESKLTQSKLTGGDIATISFLSIILCIMLASTIYDLYLFYFSKKTLHSILIAFSILSNGKKLLATSKASNKNEISCLHGIRVISTLWVILEHRYSISIMLPNRNSFDIINWIYDEKNMFIIGPTVSVDTFFVLGGLLVSYTFMSAMGKGLKFNIFAFYIHRYIRLTPLLAVIILIYVTILRHFGSGPLWKYSIKTMLTNDCEEYWWSALTYVQNYVNKHNTCVGQSWYLSVDTQLFILSPIILIPLKNKPIIGIFIAVIFTILSAITSFLIAWFYELRGNMLANTGDAFNNYYYSGTHTRAGPWLMGLILGYCIYKIKQNHKKLPINKLMAVVLWVISLTILCACAFAGHNIITDPYDRLANSFYLALLRPGWTLGLSWVILACIIGYGGPVNWFLSLPLFQVVSKLTYSMYMIHYAIQIIITSQMRSTPVFGNLEMLYAFWGDCIFTMATSLLFTLAFESPIIVIEKLIFGNEKGGRQKQKKESIQKVIEVP